MPLESLIPSSTNAQRLHSYVCTNVCIQGTVDLLLITEDGWRKADRALKWIYSVMKTPSTLILVSHSPPHDRIDLLSSVSWHDIQFKVSGTVREQAQAGSALAFH
jgi:hypothetical protein